MKLENVTKIYKMKEKDVIALENINYEFEYGKFYAIMGHSGCGKSTLISILGLIEPVTSGDYIVDGKNIKDLNDRELSNLRMKKFGFIFQDYYLDEHLKAYENVILPMIINKEIKKNQRKLIAENLLKKVGLEARIKHYPNEMSGGEQQRVSIARSLANNPDIILADEPTGNLDKENETLVFQELKKLSQEGKCIIVVSHSNEVKSYADIVINLDGGKLVS